MPGVFNGARHWSEKRGTFKHSGETLVDHGHRVNDFEMDAFGSPHPENGPVWIPTFYVLEKTPLPGHGIQRNRIARMFMTFAPPGHENAPSFEAGRIFPATTFSPIR